MEGPPDEYAIYFAWTVTPPKLAEGQVAAPIGGALLKWLRKHCENFLLLEDGSAVVKLWGHWSALAMSKLLPSLLYQDILVLVPCTVTCSVLADESEAMAKMTELALSSSRGYVADVKGWSKPAMPAKSSVSVVNAMFDVMATPQATQVADSVTRGSAGGKSFYLLQGGSLQVVEPSWPMAEVSLPIVGWVDSIQAFGLPSGVELQLLFDGVLQQISTAGKFDLTTIAEPISKRYPDATVAKSSVATFIKALFPGRLSPHAINTSRISSITVKPVIKVEGVWMPLVLLGAGRERTPVTLVPHTTLCLPATISIDNEWWFPLVRTIAMTVNTKRVVCPAAPADTIIPAGWND